MKIQLFVYGIVSLLGRDSVHDTRNTAAGQPRISRYFCAVEARPYDGFGRGRWIFTSASKRDLPTLWEAKVDVT